MVETLNTQYNILIEINKALAVGDWAKVRELESRL